MMARVRLNKWIADSGLTSRREADRLIESGAVSVNGEVVRTLGTQVDPLQDRILVHGNPLPSHTKQYLMFYKPVGVITTKSDEKGRRTIYALLPETLHHLDPVGRLDKDSSGLLLLSNDGDFIQRISHPGFHIPKQYRVRVKCRMTDRQLQQLVQGIMLQPEGKLAKATMVERINDKTLLLTLETGYNRQIRRMLEALGHETQGLKRIAIGSLRLGQLKVGSYRPLIRSELAQLGYKTLKSF